MDDAPGYDEQGHEGRMTVRVTSDDYLLIEAQGEPLQIYRRVPAGRAPHPLVSRLAYGGALYVLYAVEGDE